MKAIKKPSPVEVWQINSNYPLRTYWPDWIHDLVSSGKIVIHDLDPYQGPFSINKISITIKTIEGDMYGGDKDYVVKGNHDDVWVVQKDDFEDTYEVVENETNHF